ncbi:MAG: acyl-CoA dehydrogenase family protein [Sphingobium sp.]
MASVAQHSDSDPASGPAGACSPDQMIAAIDAAVPELQAHALEEERAGKLSDETVRRLADIGVFDIAIPREYGGMGYSTADQRRIYTAVGKIAGSTGWVTWVTTTHVRWLTLWPAQAQDEVFGLDWPAPRVSGVITANGPGRAREVEGGYMLSGKWPFASGCRHSAFCILGAQVERPDGSTEMRLMLVPTAEAEILDDWHVSGMKASSSNSVELAKETFVPAYRTVSFIQAVLGVPEKPLPADQVVFRNNFATYTSLTSGATPLGMAQGALDYFMSRIGRRGITATDYKVQADAAVTHFQVAEAIGRIEAAERLLDADAREIDRRAGADEPFDDLFRAKVRFDVAASVRSCAEAIEILHRASGASTIHEANPMQRYARDVRVATVHGQFNYETCAEDYGRALCGKPIFGSPVPSEAAAAAAPAAASTGGGAGAEAGAARVDGAWNVVITSPLGAQKSVLTVRCEGDSFAGTFEGEMGDLPIEQARVEGDTLRWSMKMTVPIPITLDCVATISGDVIEGSAAAGTIGSFPLTGVRA